MAVRKKRLIHTFNFCLFFLLPQTNGIANQIANWNRRCNKQTIVCEIVAQRKSMGLKKKQNEKEAPRIKNKIVHTQHGCWGSIKINTGFHLMGFVYIYSNKRGFNFQGKILTELKAFGKKGSRQPKRRIKKYKSYTFYRNDMCDSFFSCR